MSRRLRYIYYQMVRRTTNSKSDHYKWYGARGIKVCDEWFNDFETFKKWAYDNGYNENSPGYSQTIDRINVNGNYEPNNCRFVSLKVQANNTTKNRFITYKGRTKTMQQWCDELHIPKTTMFGRLEKMSVDEAFNKKIAIKEKGERNGKEYKQVKREDY